MARARSLLLAISWMVEVSWEVDSATRARLTAASSMVWATAAELTLISSAAAATLPALLEASPVSSPMRLSASSICREVDATFCSDRFTSVMVLRRPWMDLTRDRPRSPTSSGESTSGRRRRSPSATSSSTSPKWARGRVMPRRMNRPMGSTRAAMPARDSPASAQPCMFMTRQSALRSWISTMVPRKARSWPWQAAQPGSLAKLLR